MCDMCKDDGDESCVVLCDVCYKFFMLKNEDLKNE